MKFRTKNTTKIQDAIELCYSRAEGCAELSLHIWPRLDHDLFFTTVAESLRWIKNWGPVTTARVMAQIEIDPGTAYGQLTNGERERLARFLTETQFKRYAR